MKLEDSDRDQVYTRCANAIFEAGLASESLFLARLALLLFEQVGDKVQCLHAIGRA